MPHDTELPVTLFALGTPHGLDQLAWVVAGQLAARNAPWLSVECIRDPLRLGVISSSGPLLSILDTTLDDLPESPLWRYRWPELPVATARPVSSHAVDLRYALELAAGLQRLPPVVLVYALSAARWAEPQPTLPPDQFLREVADRLLEDLRLQRRHPENARTGPVFSPGGWACIETTRQQTG